MFMETILRQSEITITYEFLLDNGDKIGSDCEGTVMFYNYNGENYVVLPDNTIITLKEYNYYD